MINSITSFPETRFAGKKAQKKPSVLKTALIGSLLASAGAGASLTGSKPNQDNKALSHPSSLGLDQAHLAHAMTQAKQTNWDELILSEPMDAFEADSSEGKAPADPAENQASQRKLLNSNLARPWGRRPYTSAKPFVPTALAMEKAAQSTWNASSLIPMNYELFSQYTFPNTSPMRPAPLKPYTEATIKAQLVPFLNKITGGNRVKNAQAMAVFNDPILKRKAPDAKIRAALACIKALGFDAAINTYRSNVFSNIKFSKPPEERAIGYSLRVVGETQQQVWLNPKYQGEDWRLFIETLLHEALHQDVRITKTDNAEELIASATTTPVNVKLGLLDPRLFTQGTELARRSNAGTLYTLLTRGPNGELRLLKSSKPNVLPLRSQAEAYGISKPEDVEVSRGNSLLASLLKTFTGKTVRNPNFDWNTIQLLDQNQKYLSYTELLQAAKLLQLNVATPRRLRSIDELAEGPAIAPSIAESMAVAAAPAPESSAIDEEQAMAPAPEPANRDVNSRKLSRRFLA